MKFETIKLNYTSIPIQDILKRSKYFYNQSKKRRSIREFKSRTFNDNIIKNAILSAGTADIPIAEEARIILNEMGCEVITEYDVGVAGLQRLFPAINKMLNMKVDVIIAVAGR